MLKTIPINLILTISFLLANQQLRAQTVYQNQKAPEVKFTEWINNVKGDAVLQDKPIVLEFWSTWCGPCVEAIPHFNQLAEKYGKDITFVSVNSYQTKAVVENFLTKNQMSSYVALDENKVLGDLLKVQSIPVTIIIDKDGMLRWKGLTKQLTDELLDTFLAENIFHDTYNKGVILDQAFTVTAPKSIDYHLKIEYGDITKGKSASENFENGFYFKRSNFSIYGILNTFSDLLEKEEDWKFDGNLPENEIINITIKSDLIITPENVKDAESIIDDVILQLGNFFNFTNETSEETQEIWFIEANVSQMEKYLSADQSLDPSTVERTEEFTKYKNVFFPYLEYVISGRTKVKVKYEQGNFARYDLTIPKTNDILEMKKILKSEYGMDLVKKEITVKVNKVFFN